MNHDPKELTKNAQSIQNILATKGLSLKVVEFATSTRTALDAAQTIGCHVAQIVKSLIFCTKNTHRPMLILASGFNRVDEKIIEDSIGEKIVKADADFTRDITGFAIGGIPPIGHKQPIETYIDQDLLQYDQVWAAAGTPHALFSLPSKELAPLTNGKIIKIYTKKQ